MIYCLSFFAKREIIFCGTENILYLCIRIHKKIGYFMKKSKEKVPYVPPLLSVVTFRAEQGYSSSSYTTFFIALSSEFIGRSGVSNSLESRIDNGANWGGTDGWY